MILKKYKIGPVGNLIITYKRVQKDKDQTRCSLCGIGDCTTIKISTLKNSSGLLHLNLAILCKTADALRENRESYIIYVPWKIR